MSLTENSLQDNRIMALLDEVSKQLNEEDLKMLLELLRMSPGQEVEVLQELMGYTYDHFPVGTREFIESPAYLNMKGQVFPKLLDDLEELFDSKQYNEAILSGGIGWGKSTFAEIALLRMVYEVSCLKNPQKIYGLADGSVIAFMNVSINLAHAKNVVFTGVKNKINNSGYFKHKFPYDASLKSEIRFPKDIWIAPAASNEGGVIGLNVFGGVLDEVNFMAVIENSKQATDGTTYDQATQLHNAMIRRMKSRFLMNGKLPGVLLSISSSRYPDDFTEVRVKQAIENNEEDVFIRRYSQWGSKPPERYSGITFQVCLGDALVRPHIVETDEQKKLIEEKDLTVIDVPEEYLRDFKIDIDMAIRDIAGYPTLSIRPFIQQKEKLFDAVQRGEALGFKHPMSQEVTTLQDGAALQIPEEWLKYKDRPHFIHIDLGLSGDGCGIGVAFQSGMKEVIRRNDDGVVFKEQAPEIVVPMALRVVAPKDGQVQIGDVRALVYELLSYGINIRKVTFDQFQSADSIQQLKRKGIESENLSVDSKLDPYNSYRDALYEDRLHMYNYVPLIEESTRLEMNEEKRKVDHPPSGSKDVSDGVAGAVFHAIHAKIGMGSTAQLGIVESASKTQTAKRPDKVARDMVDRMFEEYEQGYDGNSSGSFGQFGDAGKLW